MPSFVAQYSTDNHPKPEQAVSYFHLDPSNNRIIQAGTEHSSFAKTISLFLKLTSLLRQILAQEKHPRAYFICFVRTTLASTRCIVRWLKLQPQQQQQFQR